LRFRACHLLLAWD